MSSEGRAKRGASGQSNAANIPYRYVGGSHEHPILDGVSRMALKSRPSDFKEFAPYRAGITGGVIAADAGFTKGFEDYQKFLA